MNNIIEKNIFNNRYNNNDDIFIHIRLGDINGKFNIKKEYYIKSIEKLIYKYENINNIYIYLQTVQKIILYKKY